jgi:hypothetical protein
MTYYSHQTCDTHSKRPHLSVVKFLKNKVFGTTYFAFDSEPVACLCFVISGEVRLCRIFLSVSNLFLNIFEPRTAEKNLRNLLPCQAR